MQKFTFNREKTRAFTDQQNQLVYHQNYLMSFINRPFSIEGFRAQMEEKKHAFSLAQRSLLHTVLTDNYNDKSTSELTKKHIDNLLKEETFTVTTGHQLSLFTGPVYFVYKILHVIKICDSLKKEYPENNFVPVFWMASEDHDFEEIQSVGLFNHTMSWESEQK
ncbi:MAG: bacillithiol biosynthesis cysteine-adding enzyme BshC, partial [Crocinitomicaceae bacterium]|nr:bacillithiol biosynthesis cysteine-adding enzyme BshC [Crocinitomicaceae bacterium]